MGERGVQVELMRLALELCRESWFIMRIALA